MTELGLLYERLIVHPGPTHSAYYMMVKRVIEEMGKDLPIPRRTREGMAHYHYDDTNSWLRKWFGDRAEVEE